GVDGLSPEAIGTLLVEAKARCPKCGSDKLSVPRPFHLMFGLEFGAKGEERAYLRPETAQSSFLAFDRMFEVGRKALPLGLAVIGKAYRNEIAPRQLLFRMRSFTQAELEVFFDPSEPGTPFDRVADVQLPVLRVERRGALGETPEPISARELTTSGGLPEFYVYYLAETYRFFRGVLGYPADAIRFWEKSDRERAFYNRLQFDVEVRIDSLGGFKELGAVHYRGDYDLARHSKGSGKDLAVTTAAGRRVLPHILEVTFGVDRNLWALADAGLRSDGERTVFHLPPYLAPVSVAVLPLLKKPHAEAARAIARRLREEGLRVAYDEAGAIGRRYARMDEAGVPFCLTVDGETVGSTPGALGSVTVRDRDSRGQERLSVEAAAERVHRGVRLPRPEPIP
ncbi:MAG TPA: glycine--tRNA ligase, partial [Thermoplasmata archaeon]|nr:glycine--tRNA ligase [Thermoplasmata archaeon]